MELGFSRIDILRMKGKGKKKKGVERGFWYKRRERVTLYGYVMGGRLIELDSMCCEMAHYSSFIDKSLRA